MYLARFTLFFTAELAPSVRHTARSETDKSPLTRLADPDLKHAAVVPYAPSPTLLNLFYRLNLVVTNIVHKYTIESALFIHDLLHIRSLVSNWAVSSIDEQSPLPLLIVPFRVTASPFLFSSVDYSRSGHLITYDFPLVQYIHDTRKKNFLLDAFFCTPVFQFRLHPVCRGFTPLGMPTYATIHGTLRHREKKRKKKKKEKNSMRIRDFIWCA